MKRTFTRILSLPLMIILLTGCSGDENSWKLYSPDGNLMILINRAPGEDPLKATLEYSIYQEREGKKVQIIQPSPLGIDREDSRFVEHLECVSEEQQRSVKDNYTLVSGKQLECTSSYNELTLKFINLEGKKMDLVFRAYDKGSAFRYRFPDNSDQQARIIREHTGFRLGEGHVWAHPYDAVTKWTPAYETCFDGPMQTGTPAPADKNGWAFPLLFESAGAWILVSESGFDGTYGASHLEGDCSGGLYRVRFAEEEEAMGYYEHTSHSALPWDLPWRFLVISDRLGDIVESNMATHLADPCALEDTDWIRPGIASWSWWSQSESPRDYRELLPFIDFAGEMNWTYSLIDANWNHMKNGSIEELADYGAGKGVGLLLWYNSGGKHNEVTEEPRNLMDDPNARRKEFRRISRMGIKGIKVDFFQSDKQEIIRQYLDILEDAAAHRLLVNFHGCTLPRGWRRTWPNLVTMESVRGGESYKFAAEFPRQAPSHLAIIPYSRNVCGPCDYTPGGFSNSTYPHLTTYGFELALTVVLESGIMHYADTPEKTADLLPEAVQLLKELPVAWDETRFLSGYPGQEAVIARRKADTWYIAAINGEDAPKELTVDPSILDARPASMQLITGGKVPTRLVHKQVEPVDGVYHIDLQPFGGFVGRLGKQARKNNEPI